jgi:diacylglycerol kinase (ATP)
MPADNVLIVVNPVAGGRRAARLVPWLTRAAATAGGRVAVTMAAGEAQELAETAAADGCPRVVAVGGDGTVQEVLNGLTARLAAPRPLLGILPAGSGNDLARTLGRPADPRAALHAALCGEPRLIDVAEATDGSGQRRRFASAGGTGFDGQVAHALAGPRALWRRGRAGYLLSTLIELRRYRNMRVEVAWEDGNGAEARIELPALMVAFANGQYYGGGMRIAPAASTEDGALDLCVVGDISRLEALRQLPGIYRGAHVGHAAVRMMRARSLRIDGEAAPVHLDGEPFGHLPLRVEVQPGAIAVATAAGSGARTES